MPGPGDLPLCSFCGRSREQVTVLIGGAHAHICDRCVSRAQAVEMAHQAGAERCGFCDKRRDAVGAMASAGETRICDECLELCDEILSDIPPVPSRLAAHVPPRRRVCLVTMTVDERKQTMTHTVLATRLGQVTVVQEDGALTGLYFPRHWPRPDRSAFGPRADEGFEDVTRQLGEYLGGDRLAFELPVKVTGSEFDLRVWELISRVPYGETTTYGDLGRSLGAGTDPRDVGAAVGRNPLCIVIPCHRVIGSTGKLTGYAGGLDRKRALLEIEHARVLWAEHAPAAGLW